MNERYVSAKEIIRSYGVSSTSLRKWSGEDKIRIILTPGGHRKYNANDVEKLLRSKSTSTLSGEIAIRPLRTGIIYARVSSQKQKSAGDLQRQIDFILERYPHHQVITDVGSGLNYQRPGFISLLERVQRGLISEIVVAQRDRLCRFAFELVQWLCQFKDTPIVVLGENNKESVDATTELAEDLLSITTVFVSRHHGRRRYCKKLSPQENSGEHQATQQECV